LLGLAAFACLAGGQIAGAADEPADPISRLGQRSAPQRWRDARSEWMGPTSRKERRQQLRQGVTLDSTFSPDVAAPEVTLPAVQQQAPIQEPPARVDLTPLTAEPEPEFSTFIAPPRSQTPVREAALPAPNPQATRVAPGEPTVRQAPDAPESTSSDASPLPVESPRSASLEALAIEQFAPAEPRVETRLAPDAPAELPVVEKTAPAAPTETAFLPQIPRTPVAPSPTPAAPPGRFAPAPPPRLPNEPQLFEVPRRDPLMPPSPDEPARVAGPVELPQLKKITEIAPFKSCATDGSGVKMCPPNTAGDSADRCPEQHPLPVFEGDERNFIAIEYCWDAPNLFHSPLYFEDVGLERYGHTYCEPFQSIASVSKFGVQLAGIPYQMALAPVHKREYPLGYYRPGDPAPYKCYQIPWNTEAALKAAYVYTGLSFITP
jgi:hypothetical protein